MLNNLITLIIIIGLPRFLIYAEKRARVIRWIGPIVLCYLTGILIANTNILKPDPGILSGITEISICLAIPLLLFSTDLKRWVRHAKKTLTSFIISVAAQSGTDQSSSVTNDSGKPGILKIAVGIALSAVVAGSGIGLSLLVTGKMTAPLIILLITSFAIGLSFISKVRNLEGTYRTAEYLLFVFAIAMGSLADLRELLSAGRQCHKESPGNRFRNYHGSFRDRIRQLPGNHGGLPFTIKNYNHMNHP